MFLFDSKLSYDDMVLWSRVYQGIEDWTGMETFAKEPK